MFSTLILAIAIVALSQFALYYWRAVVAGVAAQPLSDRVLAAARVEDGRLSPGHFDTLAGLHDLTPALHPSSTGLGLVRLYFRLVEGLDTLVGAQVPAIAAWSERESILCVRYAAVQVDRRLQANHDLVASVHSC